MALRCVYTDLDGTLLGRGGSLLADYEGNFSNRAVRALEACHRASVEVVLCSGRTGIQVRESARLIGQTSYIYELGGGLVLDGETTLLTGACKPSADSSIHRLIEERGAVSVLTATFADSLEHRQTEGSRYVSHLFRGRVDTDAAQRVLDENGFSDLCLKDNGSVRPGGRFADHTLPTHIYHLLPKGVSKQSAVAAHRRQRGYEREECVAIGDSLADLEVCEAVATLFLVRNAIDSDPGLEHAARTRQNVAITDGPSGEGFYESVVLSLKAGPAARNDHH
jgi:HAD superfamily hydrolase (TIGR01484 family)